MPALGVSYCEETYFLGFRLTGEYPTPYILPLIMREELSPSSLRASKLQTTDTFSGAVLSLFASRPDLVLQPDCRPPATYLAPSFRAMTVLLWRFLRFGGDPSDQTPLVESPRLRTAKGALIQTVLTQIPNCSKSKFLIGQNNMFCFRATLKC